MGQVITLVGAESTGKSTLARALTDALAARGLDAVMVPEALREFCDRAGRTPRCEEQAGIAAEQTRRIQEAASRHAVVLADTSALMVAVYSDYIFDDRSLYGPAERDHRDLSAMTLLTALDLPWVADGVIRDGEHVREPVDARLRQALARMRVPYAVVAGQGERRLEAALAMVAHHLSTPPGGRRSRAGQNAWRWICDHCSDGECEQHWLPRRP